MVGSEEAEAMAKAEMWGIYTFRGRRVRVIQQWADPYGRRMVRVEMAAEGDDRAEGMMEEDFLREAVPCPRPEGERV
jgi:hypothetical protein